MHIIIIIIVQNNVVDAVFICELLIFYLIENDLTRKRSLITMANTYKLNG